MQPRYGCHSEFRPVHSKIFYLIGLGNPQLIHSSMTTPSGPCICTGKWEPNASAWRAL